MVYKPSAIGLKMTIYTVRTIIKVLKTPRALINSDKKKIVSAFLSTYS